MHSLDLQKAVGDDTLAVDGDKILYKGLTFTVDEHTGNLTDVVVSGHVDPAHPADPTDPAAPAVPDDVDALDYYLFGVGKTTIPSPVGAEARWLIGEYEYLPNDYQVGSDVGALANRRSYS